MVFKCYELGYIVGFVCFDFWFEGRLVYFVEGLLVDDCFGCFVVDVQVFGADCFVLFCLFLLIERFEVIC